MSDVLTLYCVMIQFPKLNKQGGQTGKHHKPQLWKQFTNEKDALACKRLNETMKPACIVHIEERDYQPVKR